MILKSLVGIFSALFITITAFAQSGNSTTPHSDTSVVVNDAAVADSLDDASYLTAAEEMPEPIGGVRALQEKLVYPFVDKRNGTSGKVYVLAFIDETGSVAKVKIIKGVSKTLDQAAADAVKASKFTPAKELGIPVKVQVLIPIVFALD